MSGGKITSDRLPFSSVLKFKEYEGSPTGENEIFALAIPLSSKEKTPAIVVGIRFISTSNSFSEFSSKVVICSLVKLVSVESS